MPKPASNEDRKTPIKNEPEQFTPQSWISRLAVFGDSPVALGFSFAVLLASIGVSFLVNDRDGHDRRNTVKVTTRDPYDDLGPVPHMDPPVIFDLSGHRNSQNLVSEEILRAFEKDGVVAVRGLIDDELLERLDAESFAIIKEQHEKNEKKPSRSKKQFYLNQHSTIFHTISAQLSPEETTPSSDSSIARSAFLDVALSSRIPAFAVQLLGLNDTTAVPETGATESVRLLRDIFLAKDHEEYICGWHVDDMGFWPALSDSPGVNAWIALDDMPVEDGGGMALAVGSHKAEWREEAYNVIGATTTFPETGYPSAKSYILDRVGGYGTCNLNEGAPHLHRRMEETKRAYSVKRGDVLFHTRWLFHRTVPFDRDYVSEHLGATDDPFALVSRRYSLRYVPGSAVIPPGFGTEWSVLWDEANGGRSADEVCSKDGPWYPRVWPSVDPDETSSLVGFVRERMQTVEDRRRRHVEEMRPFLRQIMKQKRGR